MVDKLKFYKARLSDEDFAIISKFVESNFGIRLPRSKKAMVQNRLYKRLIATNIPSFESYVKFVFSLQGQIEISSMVDEITTNKTDFFRENNHYLFFENAIVKKNKSLNVWSAGCSTGEEPYTIAMLLDNNKVKYNITATDLSGRVIEIAKIGIYTEQITKDIPKPLLKKYFDEDIIDERKYYQVKDILRQNIKFSKLNFLSRNYNISQNYDVVFFRNVLIYFDLPNQNDVLAHIVKHLKVGGYLFIGHAEAIYDKSLPLIGVNPSVYQKI